MSNTLRHALEAVSVDAYEPADDSRGDFVEFEQVPPDAMGADAWELASDDLEESGEPWGLVLFGNRDFATRIYGSPENREKVAEILDEAENPEAVAEALTKASGKKYKLRTWSGYCQSDWLLCAYPEDTDADYLQYLEAVAFGMYAEYWNEEHGAIIYTDAEKKPLREYIAEQCGIEPQKIILRKFVGYEKKAIYKEVDGMGGANG